MPGGADDWVLDQSPAVFLRYEILLKAPAALPCCNAAQSNPQLWRRSPTSAAVATSGAASR